MIDWISGGERIEDASTTTMKEFVAFIPAPSGESITTVSMLFVLGAWAGAGVQVMMPFVSIVAPAGGFTNWYVRGRTGTSFSVAVLVTIKVAGTTTSRSGCGGSTGGFRIASTIT